MLLRGGPLKTTVERVVLALAVLAFPAKAEDVRGQVVRVTDGDTLTVLDANQAQHKIRIAGIDAPERKQPYGQASRQNLARLTFEQMLEADCYKWDRGRRICNASVNGKDIGLEQIRAGLAWHYKRFQREQTPEARRAYGDAEDAARKAQLGLWQDGANVVPPWEWRKPKARKASHKRD
jgi:endonuclease YncB( thermonuclease family)